MKAIGINNHATGSIPSQEAWFRSWFNSTFYHQLYRNRNEREAAGFIQAVLDELEPPPNATMLDLGCGSGRHSKFLAAKGFNVVGLDLANSSIRAASKSASENLRFYRHDMRNPFGFNHFDFVFNFFTSFGYFDTKEENHRVIQNISSALTPQGLVLIDYLNVVYAEQRVVPAEEQNIDGISYHIKRWMDDSHFFKEITIDITPDRTSATYTERVEKLRLQDFEILFKCHGLRLLKVYGDYQLNDYNVNNSPRLIVMAKKN
jgi:SAM-dependent methyltransferase